MNQEKYQSIGVKLTILSERIIKYSNLFENIYRNNQQLIQPFFSCLGYDCGNPEHVVLDFEQKNEHVQRHLFKIAKKGSFLLITYPITEDLSAINNVDIKSVQDLTFVVITNGRIYKFFSDIEQVSMLDKNPFFIFDLLNHNELDIHKLEFFSINTFNPDAIIDDAIQSNIYDPLLTCIKNELENPSLELLEYFLSKAIPHYNKTEALISIVRDCFDDVLNIDYASKTRVSELNSVLEELHELSSAISIDKSNTNELQNVLTFYQQRAIEIGIDPERLSLKVNKAYATINFDNSRHKWLAQIRLNRKFHKSITFSVRNETSKIAINNTTELEHHLDKIDNSIKYYNDLVSQILGC